MSVKLHSVLPILLVPDVRKTAAAYREMLGFRVCWILGDEPQLYSIVDYAEGEGFHLAYDGGKPGRKNQSWKSDHPRGEDRYLDAYIRVGDADALHAKLAQHGAKILSAPVVRPWQMKEFEVEDVNGFRLCYGADLSGEWPKDRVSTSPEFAVTDVARTAAFYRDVLGFPECALFGEPAQYGIAMRGGVMIHFFRAAAPDQVRSNRTIDAFADVDVEVSGIDELARELRGRRVKLLRGPETTEFGVTQLEVADPDGYVLCFSEPKGGWGDRSNEGRPPLV